MGRIGSRAADLPALVLLVTVVQRSRTSADGGTGYGMAGERADYGSAGGADAHALDRFHVTAMTNLLRRGSMMTAVRDGKARGSGGEQKAGGDDCG